MRPRFDRFAAGYRTTVLIVFNTALFFVLLNVMILVAASIVRDTDTNPIYELYPDISWQEVYPHMDQESIDELLTESTHIPLVYEPYIQYREAPFSSRFFNVTDQGFRQSLEQKPWPPDPSRFNVFVFGGSTTFGYGVADAETLPSHLQDELSEAIGGEVGIYNFGRAAYRSTQERLLFEELLASGFVPDLAIFVDGLNDFAHYDPNFTAELRSLFARQNQRSAQAFGTWLQENSPRLPFVRLARYLTREFLPTSAAVDRQPRQTSRNLAFIRRVVDGYIENKKLTEAAARAYSTRAVFVWQPVPMYGYALEYHPFAANGFPMNRYAADGYAYMAELKESIDLGSDFLWCADIQRDLHEPLYVDKIHYSTRMNGIVARSMTELLRERHLIPVKGSGGVEPARTTSERGEATL